MDSKNKKRAVIFRVFSILALGLIAWACFSPIWWVSLTAPQYPPDTFPDGIRISFHVDSVQNGCTIAKRTEVVERESLNCKHEMDAINHFIGMHPIAAGGPVERSMSIFAMSLMGLMILTFMVSGRKKQVGVFLTGSILIFVWMSAALYTKGGIKYLTPNYIADLEDTMDLYPEDYADWSVKESIDEVYTYSLTKWFPPPKEELNKQRKIMQLATEGVYFGILAVMVLFTLGLAFTSFTYWLLALVPAMIPIGFLLNFSGWLWWFGHTLNDMGAFSLKAFMPTVLGDGIVAQFHTYSYPHSGFYMLMAASALLVLAFLIRKRQLRQDKEG